MGMFPNLDSTLLNFTNDSKAYNKYNSTNCHLQIEKMTLEEDRDPSVWSRCYNQMKTRK